MPHARHTSADHTPVPGPVSAQRPVGRATGAVRPARGARVRRGGAARSFRRLDQSAESVVRVLDRADRIGGCHEHDPDRDVRDPDPVPEPGHVRATGAHAGSRLPRAAGDRPGDGPRGRSVLRDARDPRLGREGACGPAGGIRRDRGSAAARGVGVVSRHVLPGRWCDHDPSTRPVTTAADHDRCAGPGDDAPRRPPGRRLEQPVVPRSVR